MRKRNGLVRRLVVLSLLFVGSGAIAPSATAAPMFEADVFDFARGWNRPLRSGVAIEQGADRVTLSGSYDAAINAVFSRQLLKTDIAFGFIDARAQAGRLSLVAIKFDADGERIGRERLGRSGDGFLDLRSVDWNGTDHIKLKLKLTRGSRVSLHRLELHAPAVPEPSAGLLMGLGMVATAAHLRFRRSA